ncbi:MAG: hypothetical protein IJX14_04830 [Clostridia bacterium]|nr:hypothetical protein [Clostridia bacterium]
MSKKFWNNPRPLVFSLCAMTFLCIFLLVLYLFAEKENALLQASRSDQFLALAAGEAEEAVLAYREEKTAAEVYHRICSAAEYLSMAAPTEENRKLAAQLQEAGELLLRGELLPESSRDSLEALGRRMTDKIPATDVLPEETAPVEVQYPWKDMPCISRTEGLTIAETLTETKNCLTPAAGKSFVYTCKNVYVKLSQTGGIPLEIAVYTPVKHEPSYARELCAFRSSRFLEAFLPRRLRERDTEAVEETDSLYRFWYPCGNWQVRVDVRMDTGRVTGLQMHPV